MFLIYCREKLEQNKIVEIMDNADKKKLIEYYNKLN